MPELRAYVLTKDYHTSPSAKAGTVVYELCKADYGLSRDDTVATGVHHVSVTLDPTGDYPFFTYPSHLLKEVTEVDKDNKQLMIEGKVYAGELSNARPCFQFGTSREYRTIKGYCHKDLKNRGFDRGDIRTSVVEKLIIHEGDVYAITMNSAYKLDNMRLQEFLASPTWMFDVATLCVNALAANQEKESKID